MGCALSVPHATPAVIQRKFSQVSPTPSELLASEKVERLAMIPEASTTSTSVRSNLTPVVGYSILSQRSILTSEQGSERSVESAVSAADAVSSPPAPGQFRTSTTRPAELRRRPFAPANLQSLRAPSILSTDRSTGSSSSSGSSAFLDFFEPTAPAAETKSLVKTTTTPNGNGNYVTFDEEWRSLGAVKLAFEAAGLGLPQQSAFLAALTTCTFQPHEYIVREGEVGDAFYIITSGEVSVTQKLDSSALAESAANAGVLRRDEDGEVVITLLYEGHFFGEMSLLTSAPRNANVKAMACEVTCRRLSQVDFLHFVSTDESFRLLVSGFAKAKTATAKKRTEMLAAAELYVDKTDTTPHAVDVSRTVKKGRTIDGRSIINGYILDTKLGGGAFGVVWLAHKCSTKEKVAIKIINRRTLLRAKRFSRNSETPDGSVSSAADDAAVLSEVAVMKRLSHRNVVCLYEVIDDPDSDLFYLVQEYCELGPIFSEKEYNCPLKPDLVRAYMRDIYAGLEYLHFQGICHRDLKPSNILIAADGTAKIADFGASAIMGLDSEGTFADVRGTPAFSPPEVFSETGARYSGTAADLWSLGATLHTMVVGVPPFMAATELELVDKLRNAEVRLSAQALQLDPHLKNLLLRCLDKNAATRATLHDVLTHAWITEEGAAPLVHAPYKKVDLYAATPLRRSSFQSNDSSSVGSEPPRTRPIINTLSATSVTSAIELAINKRGAGVAQTSPPHLTRCLSKVAAEAMELRIGALQQRQRALLLSFKGLSVSEFSTLSTQAHDLGMPLNGDRAAASVEDLYVDASGRFADAPVTAAASSMMGAIAENTTTCLLPHEGVELQKASSFSLLSTGTGGASEASFCTMDDSRVRRGGGKLMRTKDFFMMPAPPQQPQTAVELEVTGVIGSGRITPERVGTPSTNTTLLLRKLIFSAHSDDGSLSIMGGRMQSPPPSQEQFSARSPSSGGGLLQNSRASSRGELQQQQQQQLSAATPPMGESSYLSQSSRIGSFTPLQSPRVVISDDDDDEEEEELPDISTGRTSNTMTSSDEETYMGVEVILSCSVPNIFETGAQMFARTSAALGDLNSIGELNHEQQHQVQQHDQDQISPHIITSATMTGDADALSPSERLAWDSQQRKAVGSSFARGLVLRPDDVARMAEEVVAAAAAPPISGGGILSRATLRSTRKIEPTSMIIDSEEIPPSLSSPTETSLFWPAQFIGARFVCCPVGVSDLLGFTFGVADAIGKRDAQEDRCIAISSLRTSFPSDNGDEGDGVETAFFAVCDGHGGAPVSEALTQLLPAAVARLLQTAGGAEQAALKEVCREVDAALPEPADGEAFAGSTACMVLVRGKGGEQRKLICANIGDSRAVLSRRGVAMPLSDDHKPFRPDEHARILAAGGTVVRDRLHGVLAVSRAFGDMEHKAGRWSGLWSTAGTVLSADPCSAEPEFVQHDLIEGDDFVIIACDGVWDIMSSQTACNFITRRLLIHSDAGRAARELVSRAIALGSMDNVSAIVIVFRTPTHSAEESIATEKSTKQYTE